MFFVMMSNTIVGAFDKKSDADECRMIQGQALYYA